MPAPCDDPAVILILYVQSLLRDWDRHPEAILMRRLLGKLTLDEIGAMAGEPTPQPACCSGCGQPVPSVFIQSTTESDEPFEPFGTDRKKH